MTELMRVVVASGHSDCPTHAVRPVRSRLPRPRRYSRILSLALARTVLYQVVQAHLETWLARPAVADAEAEFVPENPALRDQRQSW